MFDDSTGLIDTTPAGLDSEKNDYGIITYVLRRPIRIGTGGKTFIVSMDLSGVSLDGGGIKLTILGGDNFDWDDGASAGSTTFNGDSVHGLPFSSSTVGITR